MDGAIDQPMPLPRGDWWKSADHCETIRTPDASRAQGQVMSKNPHAVALGKRRCKGKKAELREHMAMMGRKGKRRKWLHDPDPENEWWWVERLPIGVMREGDGTRWTPAYQDDGLPAGSGTGYTWFKSLEDAKAAALRLNRYEEAQAYSLKH